MIQILKGEFITTMSDEEFYNFCQQQEGVRLERNSNRELIIMAPSTLDSASADLEIGSQIRNWNLKTGQKGKAFGSAAGFTLPNGAVRSPDAGWISNERFKTSGYSGEGFIKACPEFVVEVKSPSDTLMELEEKMQEYLENGSLLGWIVDPKSKQIYIFKSNNQRVIKNFDEEITGENVLGGFTLDTSTL
jgi:Uma2 family endonuclease